MNFEPKIANYLNEDSIGPVKYNDQERLDEFVWTPAASAGLYAVLTWLFGATIAFWILMGIGILAATSVVVLLGVTFENDVRVGIYNIINSYKMRTLGKNITTNEVEELANKIKSAVEQKYKGSITSLQNQIIKALEDGRYEGAAYLFNRLKDKMVDQKPE